LITHTHSDHFYPEELRCKRKGYCKEDTVPTLRVYGSSDVKKTVFSSLSYANELCKGGRVAFIELSPYEPLDVEGYTVTAYPAKHGTDNPYFYSLSKDGKSILIMNDTARPNPEVMQKLKESGESFDLVSFECTFGNCDYFARHGDRAKHMGIVDNIAVRELLVKNGNVKDSTVYVITHFTHNGFDVGYGDMARLADRHGFILAYDGIEIEI